MPSVEEVIKGERERRMLKQKERINENLRNVKKRIAVMSGKGGVGKTMVAVNIAALLAEKYKVGLFDVDIDCPNVNKFLGIPEKVKIGSNNRITPIEKHGMRVLSMAFLMEDEAQSVIWRGPIISNAIMQFMENTDWGELDYLIADMPPGCLSKDTMIFANQRPVKISDLKKGDYIYAFEGSFSKKSGKGGKNVFEANLVKKRVEEVIPQGRMKIFHIKTQTKTIKCTANHPFLTVSIESTNTSRNKYNLIWKRAAELSVNDILVVNKKIAGEEKALKLPSSTLKSSLQLHIPEYITDDFMRIAGYFIGDGYIRKNKKGRYWSVLFCEPAQGKYREFYKNLLKKTFRTNHIYEDYSQFGIISNRLSELFDKLGLSGGAKNKTVPPWIFELPISQKLAFIEGYCDADGYRRKGKKGYRKEGWLCFETPNKNLIEQLRLLCMFSGLRVNNLNKRHRRILTPSRRLHEQDYWYFECSQKSQNNRYGAGLIRGNVGSGFINDSFGFERIKSIKFISEEETYDLSIEDGSNFIAEGFVVHNTSDAALTMMQLIGIDAAIIVSTPQIAAIADARKAIHMCKHMGVPIVGVVENMSGFFGTRVAAVAEEEGVPFLGSIELRKDIAELSDLGLLPVKESAEVRKIFEEIITAFPDEYKVK